MNDLHFTTIGTLNLLWFGEQESNWCRNTLEGDEYEVDFYKSVVRKFRRPEDKIIVLGPTFPLPF